MKKEITGKLKVVATANILSNDESVVIGEVESLLSQVVYQYMPHIDDDFECMSKSLESTITIVKDYLPNISHKKATRYVGLAYIKKQNEIKNRGVQA